MSAAYARHSPVKSRISESDIAIHSAAIEDGDSNLLLAVLGDIARAKGMSQLARNTGLGRESLYKALTPGAKPRFDTIMKVIQGMGVHLHASA